VDPGISSRSWSYFPDGAHDDQVDALSGAHASLVELLKALESHEGEVVMYSDEGEYQPGLTPTI